MGSQSSRGVSSAQYESESVIQFAPAAKGAAPNKGDELDSAGRSILGLLHKAAGVAEANSHHALELAQKLSQELRAAEDRIAQLETDVRYYQERTDRARPRKAAAGVHKHDLARPSASPAEWMILF